MTKEEQLYQTKMLEKIYREGFIDGLWHANNEIMKKISELQTKMHKDYPGDYDNR